MKFSQRRALLFLTLALVTSVGVRAQGVNVTSTVSVVGASEPVASALAKGGVSYLGTEDTYPSYLHLLSQSDRAEVDRAKANIERYRKSNVTITVLDNSGIPLEGVEIAFNQTDHNFLFGFQDFEPFLFGSASMMKQAGFNLFVATPYWVNVECRQGVFKWDSALGPQRLEQIRSMGFKIKVHPVVYYASFNIPAFLKTATPTQLKSETLVFVSELLRNIPYANIYELSNEDNRENMRGGLSIEEYIHLLKQVSQMIRTVQKSTTITCNTAYTFGEEGGPVGYFLPDMSPLDWYKFLISERVDFDAIGVQFRPAYYAEWQVEHNRVPALTEVSQKFDQFAALGKRIHITEFQLPSKQTAELKRYGNSDWNETMQAAYVEGFYTLMFSKQATDSIVWWFIQSCLPVPDEEFEPRPFALGTSQMTAKASYYTLKSLITSRWSTRGLGLTDAHGNLRYRGFGGAYALSITHRGLTKKVDICVADGVSTSYRITFDRDEVSRENEAATAKLRRDAENILHELHLLCGWAKTVNEVKLADILDTTNVLTRLYNDAQYAQVIELGDLFLQNPFQMNVSGRRLDFNGFSPVVLDAEGDTSTGSPVGTDLVAMYAFADLHNLYVAIAVVGNRPYQAATFTVEIEAHGQKFHAAVANLKHESACWEMPWPGPQQGGIRFACAYAMGEIVEIRVPTWQLNSSNIRFTNLWIWQENAAGQKLFDSYDGSSIEIPSLKGFMAKGFDFSVSNSGGITATQGGSGSNTVTVTLVLGSTQSVFLSAFGLPYGASASFNPSSSNPTFTSQLTITTSSATRTGSCTITVIGIGGGLARTTSFALTIALTITRIVLDASPKPGYINKPVTVSGVMYGSWRCIRDAMVVGKPVEIKANWGFITILTTDYYGRFSVTTDCPPTGGTYNITATFYEDQDLAGNSTTIQYQVIAKIPTTLTIGYVGNREFAGYLRRQDTGTYLAYKPVKLTVTYLSGTIWQTTTYDLQTRQDGYYSLEFLFYWNRATIAFEGDETYASSSATITR